MAALTDAMKWYNLGGLKAARLKFHFKVEFFSSQYTAQLQTPARLMFDAVRTIELPKYSIETEVANAWNVRQPIPTKINFEPLSVAFTDTLDNRFQNFIKNYMNIISGSFAPQTKSMRKGFDDFGIKMLESGKDCPIDKIVITRFYGADIDREKLQTPSVVTLWRPKIVDVQHDTLDYSASEAVTWQVSLRYESVTYSDSTSETGGSQQATSANRNNPYVKQVEDQIKLNNSIPPKDLNAEYVKQAQDQIKLNNAVQNQLSNPMPAESLNGMSFKDASALGNANRTGAGNLPGGGV
jgi:hypothetical protein